jgi:thiosulfate/3-mercaptopyruvate sulfurtransferase
MPGAVNVPWADLVDPQTGVFLETPALRSRFEEAGVDLGKPIVTTCASGLTSCMDALALYLVGRADVSVYDGSWAEWERAEEAAAVAA